jgi:hypothetical protein
MISSSGYDERELEVRYRRSPLSHPVAGPSTDVADKLGGQPTLDSSRPTPSSSWRRPAVKGHDVLVAADTLPFADAERRFSAVGAPPTVG